MKWQIKEFFHTDKQTVVEWYFECSFDNGIDGFDGVSIVEFNDNLKVVALREFQSKTEHYFPYGE